MLACYSISVSCIIELAKQLPAFSSSFQVRSVPDDKRVSSHQFGE